MYSIKKLKIYNTVNYIHVYGYHSLRHTKILFFYDVLDQHVKGH